MVHKPKHRVHSFRGLLADGGEDEINLERQNVNLAYRVVKFELFAALPGGASQESIVKIQREQGSTIDGTVDFTDTNLLGVGYLLNHLTATDNPAYMDVIFDNTLFSRNIYITHIDVKDSHSCNYYIELEEVPVSASTLMQLKLGVARKLNLQQD